MRVVYLTLILAACGTDKKESTQEAGPEQPPAVAPQQPAPGPAPQQPVADAPMQSLAVTTAEELPACNADNNRQLVYVLSSKEFHTCQAGQWVKIDLPQPKQSVADIVAVLASIELGKTLAELPAAAQGFLASAIVETKDLAAPQDVCTPGLPGIEYQNVGRTMAKKYSDGTSEMTFAVEFRSGKVESVRYAVVGKPDVAPRVRACTDR